MAGECYGYQYSSCYLVDEPVGVERLTLVDISVVLVSIISCESVFILFPILMDILPALENLLEK